MSRMTEYKPVLNTKDPDSEATVILKPGTNEQDALRRLAAYEDLSLTPEELSSVLRVGLTPEEMKEMYLRERARYDEWYAWKEAEQEGKLFVVPCKIGDTVYSVNTNGLTVLSWEVTGIWISREGNLMITANDLASFNADAVGKTVFLRKEEAEAKRLEIMSTHKKEEF